MGSSVEKINIGVALFLGLITFGCMLQVSIGDVYKVGDSAGWTIIGNVDYKQWAAPKTFQVGDVIGKLFSPFPVFIIYYDPQPTLTAAIIINI